MVTSYTIVTASNFSIFVLFVLGFMALWASLRDDTRGKTFHQRMKLFLADNFYRAPFGFLLTLGGLIIRVAPGLVMPVLREESHLDIIRIIDEKFLPLAYMLGEYLIFGGLLIVFWPTVKKHAFKILGPGFPDDVYTAVALIGAFTFKVVLTFLGIFLHYLFTL